VETQVLQLTSLSFSITYDGKLKTRIYGGIDCYEDPTKFWLKAYIWGVVGTDKLMYHVFTN
jgi:hypothetical protein